MLQAYNMQVLPISMNHTVLNTFKTDSKQINGVLTKEISELYQQW